MKSLESEIQSLENIDFKVSCDLSKFTTIKLKKVGDVLIVRSLESLKKSLEIIKRYKKKYHLVGWGANQILLNTKDVIFIKIMFDFDRSYLASPKDEYVLPANVPLNILTSHAKKFGLSGWEVFTGIPASLGGAIYMNAGTNLGEMKDIVKSVTILRTSLNVEEVVVDETSFSYRENSIIKPGDIIVGATLFHHGLDDLIGKKIDNYLTLRKETQPLQSFNCGCVFKNFDINHRAGQYIDVIGLKGLRLGDLMVSEKHANFIENTGSAKSEDFVNLTEELKYQLELFSGIQFELEAKVY